MLNVTKYGLVILVCLGGTNLLAEGPLVHESTINAPVSNVWHAFTTQEGLESWMVAHAQIDLRVGGKMLTNYQPDGVIGDENTIENTILSFEPERMLSLKATKPPANFPFKSAIKNTWSVTYFESLGANRTRIRVVGMGYGQDEESQKMRKFFDWGNAWTVEQLSKKFASSQESETVTTNNESSTPTTPSKTTPTTSDDEVLRILHHWVGGDWIHEEIKDVGKAFRSHNRVKLGADGQSLVAQSWLGFGKGMFYHGDPQIWREPLTGEVRYQNISETGAVARGAIRLTGKDALTWDWNTTSLKGKETSYRVITTHAEKDRYRMQLQKKNDDGKFGQLFDIEFQRVSTLPAAFSKMQRKAD